MALWRHWAKQGKRVKGLCGEVSVPGKWVQWRHFTRICGIKLRSNATDSRQTTSVQVTDDSWYQRRPDVLAFISSG